jgi:hypothetical protein
MVVTFPYYLVYISDHELQISVDSGIISELQWSVIRNILNCILQVGAAKKYNAFKL